MLKNRYIFSLACLLLILPTTTVFAKSDPLGVRVEQKCTTPEAQAMEYPAGTSTFTIADGGQDADTDPHIILKFSRKLSPESVRRFINKEEIKDDYYNFMESLISTNIWWKYRDEKEEKRTLEVLKKTIGKGKDVLPVHTGRNYVQNFWISGVRPQEQVKYYGDAYVNFPSSYSKKRVLTLLKKHPIIDKEKTEVHKEEGVEIAFSVQRGQEKCIATELSKIPQIAKVEISYWDGEE